jgi:hypothetical protein
MPKIEYIEKRFHSTTSNIIDQANSILEDFIGRGFDLTVRQLYYQFIAQDLFPDSWRDKNPPYSKNIQKNYKRLGSIINDARLAGLIDWSYIVDRTRNLQSRSHWDSPSEIIDSAAYSYHNDMWQNQGNYVEIWIEKDALIGVIERPCSKWDVPYFSCRGYTSQSEMWTASERFLKKCDNEDGYDFRDGVLIHLSDHDPSGLDMEEDIINRFRIFGAHVSVERIALTMNQINNYSLPPNPAKITDSRYDNYANQYGTDSWELDALDPSVLSKLVEDKIKSYITFVKWDAMKEREKHERSLLTRCSEKWVELTEIILE